MPEVVAGRQPVVSGLHEAAQGSGGTDAPGAGRERETFRSPLRDGAPARDVTSSAAIEDHTGLFVAEVRGVAPDAPRERPTGWAVRCGDQLRWAVVPGRWHVIDIGGPAPRGRAGAEFLDGSVGPWTDLTHGVAVLRLRTDAAVKALAAICPVDIAHADPGYALRTSMAQVAVHVVADAESAEPWIIVPRSYAAYFTAVLVDAVAHA